MPGQTAKPTLAGRFGARYAQAAAKGAAAPVRYGRRDLPGGIKAGIARLMKVEIKEYDQQSNMKQLDGSPAKGQLYAVFSAACVEPKEHLVNGVPMPTEGVQFYETIPVCEKGARYKWLELTDLDACVQEVQNLMRAVAGEGFDARDVDKACAVLTQAKPYFRFSTRTRPGGKNPTTGKEYPESVEVTWIGGQGLENYKDPTAGAGAVADGTGAVRAQANGQASKPTAAPVQAAPAEEPDPFDETAADLGADAALVDANPDAAAKPGTPENEANNRLSEAAVAAGLTDEDLGKFGSWREILDHMQSLAVTDGPGNGDEVEDDDDEVEEEEEEAKAWAKGDECLYAPPKKGPGGKTVPGKAVTCVITGLNKSGTKANVKEKAKPDNKYKDVPVDALTRP